MACKGCKKKPLSDLNELPAPEEKNPKVVFILIIIYTLLAGYGLIRLLLDLKNLFI